MGQGVGLSNQYGVLNKSEILRNFQFTLIFPPPIVDIFEPIFASATSLPGREVTDIELDIGGTTVKYPGPPVFNNNWTVTFRDDTGLKLRRALDKHMGPIAFYGSNPTFQKQMEITVKVEGPGADASIILKKAYISSIGEITMDYGNDAIATYDVTFNYHRWEFK